MKVNDVIVNEAKMNPSSFANAIKEGGDKGVLVGFEFEVCVPEKTIKMAEAGKDYVLEKLVRAFKEEVGFGHLGYSRSHGGDYITPAIMDKCLRPNPLMDPKYSTFAEAVRSIPRSERGYRDDYSDVVKQMFPDVGSTARIERNLSDYFEILDAGRLYKKLQDFDLVYTDEPDDENGDYEGAAKVLKPAVEKAMNAEVRVFDSYHQAQKDTKTWYIEPDGSLYPTGPRDGTAEIVSPPLPANQAMAALQSFYAMAKQLDLYTSADNHTGLHINVSIPGTLDVLKLAVFLGEKHVLQYFKREDNEYVKSVIKSLNNLSYKPSDLYKTKVSRKKNKVFPSRERATHNIDYGKLKNIIDMQTKYDHFASINNTGKYISFRHAGGDYLNDYQGVLDVVGRFVRAMIIASNPNLYQQEYLKKLTKLFGVPKAEVSPKMATIQGIKGAIDQIKTKGLPVLIVSLVTKQGRFNWQNKIDRAIYDLTRSSRVFHYFNVGKLELVNNSNDAKKELLAKMWTTDEEDFGKLPMSKYAQAIVLPNPQHLSEFYKQRDDGERLLWGSGLSWSDNDKTACSVKIEMLPFNNPLAQKVYKEMIKGANVNESYEYPENPIYYFAYGMLTDPKKMPGQELVGVAELKNFEYKMYQFANVEPKSGSSVYGTLWAIDRNVLSYLDKIEGYPELYDRRTYPVYVDGDKYVAEVYVMTPFALRYSEGEFPSQDYLKSVYRGYLHAGVPTQQIQKALRGE